MGRCGYFGALYSFKGGTLEVAVKISGIPEPAALAAAKKFFTRAMGSTGKTGYAYHPPGTTITAAITTHPAFLARYIWVRSVRFLMMR